MTGVSNVYGSPTGSISVNEYVNTNVEEIETCGDLVEYMKREGYHQNFIRNINVFIDSKHCRDYDIEHVLKYLSIHHGIYMNTVVDIIDAFRALGAYPVKKNSLWGM